MDKTQLHQNLLLRAPQEVVQHVRAQLGPGVPPDTVRVHPQVRSPGMSRHTTPCLSQY